MMTQNKSEQTKNSFLAMSAGIGVLRSVIGLPYEHPLDCIKTVMQADQKRKGVIETIQRIYQQHGLKGFYAGYIPNCLRMAFKQLYRTPLMIYLPNLVAKTLNLPSDKNTGGKMSKMVTGVLIALADVVLANPFERLKVWLMTNQNRDSATVFFRQSKNILKDLFKGFEPSLWRQISSWISFLVADDMLKT